MRKIGQNSKQRLIILTVVYSLSSTKPLNLLNDVGLRSLLAYVVEQLPVEQRPNRFGYNANEI